ncbi:DUF1552 domain-containing protein [Singulisphaera acidiphila]|uniref:DUF1552 domain-containing protein n=1 Tax=Singulisphaera acidiphila (strain ATCC BAA-1392 / DSM 18658 / VKM B-2454 / MOB10) TaxID=886293 RepID=L0DLF1_SINAD|nr:DUF1552 domain-containing protein [Singulisphaera acidiphila]AGA30072.1 Protein of unknown function (DUF1552) [Singulisphaera acidiphila DSM 18658]
MTHGGRISRRTVLRGLGTVVSLPFLEAMRPQLLANAAAAAGQAASPRRLAFIYVPNGAIMDDWTPTSEGAGFELPAILQPLAPYRDEMLVLSELTCDKARPNGDGAGDHARASSAFLTGCQARKTAGANFRSGISADQVVATRLGDRTRLSSLELGIERYRGTGNCDSGYSCVYEHTMSWRSSTSPLPNEVDPRLVFERLFSDQSNDPGRLKRNRLRASVLDAVIADARGLEGRLGGADRQKLDQYLTCVRELELRIARAESLPPIQPPAGAVRPESVPADLAEHFHLMCDLMVLAFQTDVTRVATCMFGREGSELRYKMVGVSEGHHELTHHRGDPDKIDKVRSINTFHIQQFAYLIGKLKSIPEGEGTLLDNCMIAYGSGNSDGNRHTHDNLPILVAGKGGGSLKTGRHIRFPKETPVNNLWLSLLDRMGARLEQLGDSTGHLEGLA